jgi:hypothetical protein
MVARSDLIRDGLWKPYVRFRGKSNMGASLVDRCAQETTLVSEPSVFAPHEFSADKGLQFAGDTRSVGCFVSALNLDHI